MQPAAVCSVEPALLLPVRGVVPASETLEQHAGKPAVLRVQGDWSALEARPAHELAAAQAFLGRAMAVTLAEGAAPLDLPFDLRAANASAANPWVEGFLRAPAPCLAGALLVREPPVDVWSGLVAESATYSMLQAGPEFHAWRERSTIAPADDEDEPRIRVGRSPGAVEIVLTRPVRHNSLDVRMRDELYEALAILELEPETAIVLRAEGPSFCSGGDLGEFGSFPDPATAHVVRLGRSLARQCAVLGGRMVVGIHGLCLGSGIELPAFAARVVAADDVEIGLPEAGLGLIPGAGGTVSIARRCGSQRLLELLFTGDRIEARTALEWGLVDEVVPRAELESRLWEVVRTRSRTR